MNEDFVQYVWRFGLFNHSGLKTLQGDKIQIIKPGLLNTNSGPDFLNAQVKIGEVLWAGNVEIHTNTSDWVLHKHGDDPAFSNIILHVVFNHNLEYSPQDFPLLELRAFVNTDLINNFKRIKSPYDFIPCEKLYHTVSHSKRQSFLEGVFIQKLQDKCELYKKKLELLNGDRNQLMFNDIAYTFGLKINAEAFYSIARSIPFKLIRKYKEDTLDLEALIFGQAGLIDKTLDSYSLELYKRYTYIQHKHGLSPIDTKLIRFSRLRPPNFPTIRLAQMVAFLAHFDSLNDIFELLENSKTFKIELKSIVASEYWNDHYVFGKISKTDNIKSLSDSFIDLLLINSLLPLKFFINKLQPNFDPEEIIDLYAEINSEVNSIIKEFKLIGANVKTAIDSQSLLYLKKTFCDQKKCLHCNIGNQIIKYV